MAVDLQNRPSTPDSDDLNPGNKHYDDVFNKLTSAEHMAKDGQRQGQNTAGDGNARGTATNASAGSSVSPKTSRAKSLASSYSNKRSALGARVGSLMKKKWMIGFGIGGAGIGGLLILLLLFLSAYKIPHLMENITAYQFARVFQQDSLENNRVIGQKITVDAAEGAEKSKIANRYETATGKAKDLKTKVDKLRPNKVIQNLVSENNMQFNYKGSHLVGITMYDKTTLVPKTTFAKGLIPGYKFTQSVKLASQFQPALNEALRANDIGPVTRAAVAKNLRKQLGISLIAWTAGSYKGKTTEQARLKTERETYKATKAEAQANARSEPLKNGVDDVEKARDATVGDDKALSEAIKNGGTSKAEINAIKNAVSSSAFQTGLKYANGVYAVATPVCIVYDGSMQNAGADIDANSDSGIRAYNHAATVADQVKDGKTSDLAAVRAYDDKLGNINGTLPMQRASGQDYDTDDGVPSAQAAPGGGYSIFDAIFGGNDSDAAKVAEAIADKSCPVLTNTAVAGGVALVNLIPVIATLGGAAAAEDAAGAAATKTATSVVNRVVEKSLAKRLASQSVKAKTILGDSVKSGIKIAAVTVLAKMIVAQKAGEYNTGLEQKADYVHNIDSGGNLNANEIMRRQNYGAPLNQTGVVAAYTETQQLVAKQNESKSTYQRYLAISNPNSLLTHFGMSLMGLNVKSTIASIVDPSRALSATFGSFNKKADAATADKNLTYGNIQWGWTKEEKKLMTQVDYQVLENQKVLDDSGRESDIANAYGKCFSPDTTIGTLLQDGDIQRDDDGNVTNGGDCSPANLGLDNSTYGPQMVFRWRLAQADNQKSDDLADLQEVTEPTTDATGDGGSFRIASYNVKGANHTPGTWRGRIQKSIGVIKENHPDVIGLQELQAPQRKILLDQLGSTYDIYPKSASVPHHQSENSIVWDKSKFDFVSGGIMPNLKYFGGEKLDDPYVKLTYIATGQQLYIMNTHDPAHSGNEKLRFDDMNQHADFIKKLKADNIPIFFSGDFNSGYCSGCSGENHAYLNKDANTSYCIMTKDDFMKDGYDLHLNRPAKCPNQQLPEDSKGGTNAGGVDHIFMSPGVTVQAWAKVPPGKSGSDHPAIIFDVTMPGDGAKGDLTLGSYNLLDGTAHAGDSKSVGQCSGAGNGDACIDKRTNQQVKILTGGAANPAFDVFGTQETAPKQYRALKTALDGYAVYPTDTSGLDNSKDGELAIWWDTAKFTLVDSGKAPGRSNVAANINNPWVELQSETGKKFFVMSVHYANTAYGGGAAEHDKAAAKTVDWVKSKATADTPAFVVGDFNEHFEKGPIQHQTVTDRAYCVYTANKVLQNAYDMYRKTSPDKQCPTKTNPGPNDGTNEGRDQIYATPFGDVQATAWGVPTNDGIYKTSSDHRPVYASFSLDSSAAGASRTGVQKDGWQWPVVKSNFKGLSQCFEKPGHTGLDLRAAVGTSVYAAKDGTVVKVDPSDSGDGGKYIIIQHGPDLFSNYQHNSRILVQVGQQVKAGDKIALSGNTGNTTGPHVHFSITTQNGLDSRHTVAYSIDPLGYLPNDRDETCN